jgi:hypothetical protein
MTASDLFLAWLALFGAALVAANLINDRSRLMTGRKASMTSPNTPRNTVKPGPPLSHSERQ